jgi:hypothetical protein
MPDYTDAGEEIISKLSITAVFAKSVATRGEGEYIEYYSSLADAVYAGGTQGVVTVLSNVTVDETIMINNGGTLTILPKGGAVITIGRGSGTGSLFAIGGSGQAPSTLKFVTEANNRLIVDGGNKSAEAALITVQVNGTFDMPNEVTLQNNQNTGNNIGGGVCVIGGAFTMRGGNITGNSAGEGGGVYVADTGEFTMAGGNIAGNSADAGGGVYNNGSFTMGGDAVLAQDNYVYLPKDKKIRLDASLSNIENIRAVIHPEVYPENEGDGEVVLKVLEEDDGNGKIAGNYIWFKVKPDDNEVNWSVNNQGNLTMRLYNVLLKAAQQDFTAYETIQGAIDAAGGGPASIMLIGNIELESAITIDKTVTISGLVGDSQAIKRASGLSSDMFTVSSNGVLTLESELKLDGNKDSFEAVTGSLVKVDGGTFTMKSGVTLANNKYSGVCVNTGKFVMEGGTISGNIADSGGGVYAAGGAFTMSGGIISGNTANMSGGGVYAAGGTFTMSGGIISGNTANMSGGVYIHSGTFKMSGGEISGNAAYADNSSGGVYFASGAFTMSGGAAISGNTNRDVLAAENFIMKEAARAGKVTLLSGKYIEIAAELSPPGGVSAEIDISGIDIGAVVLNGSNYNLTQGDCDKFTISGYTDDDRKINLATNNQGIIQDMTTMFASRSVQGATMYYTSIKEAIGAAAASEVITVLKNHTIDNNGNNITVNSKDITLAPRTGTVTITRGVDGAIFNVSSSGSLTLKSGITLEGNSVTSSSALVKVDGGTFTMKSGVTLANSKYSGVYVNTGKFVMEGGAISNNTVTTGGGVYVAGGEFTMSGGAISGNTAQSGGGGVYVAGGKFTMSGGAINDNTAQSGGGGVYIADGTFNMRASAAVNENNDVYLMDSKVITVGSLNGNGTAARIKPANTQTGTPVLKAENGDLDPGLAARFILDTSAGDGMRIATNGTDGILASPEASLFSNGKITYHDNLNAAVTSAVGSMNNPDIITLYRDVIITTEIQISNKHIKLVGGGIRTIGRGNASGGLFNVAAGASLTLTGSGDKNTITLNGNGNTADSALVKVLGVFTMNEGAVLQSNKGGGVYVSGGTFIMSGGTISGNTAENGGGVYVASGTFTMSGNAAISGNNANAANGNSVSGGGVYLINSTFTMLGGKISGNAAGHGGYGGYGGGVCADSGKFIMLGGEISSNTATTGGGVYMKNNGTFTKKGGKISGYGDASQNIAAFGHAVYINSGTDSYKIRSSTADESIDLDSATDANWIQ